MLWFSWFKKTFDHVDHDILLSKMKPYGIQGIALDGLDRIWQVVHNDVSLMVLFLESVHLNAGYRREQFLVPFWFLIYINDLPNCLTSCQPRMYADDTHITYADVDMNSTQLNLKHDLGNLNKWLFSNKLTLKKLQKKKQQKNWIYANWIKTKIEYFVQPTRALDW